MFTYAHADAHLRHLRVYMGTSRSIIGTAARGRRLPIWRLAVPSSGHCEGEVSTVRRLRPSPTNHRRGRLAGRRMPGTTTRREQISATENRARGVHRV